MKNITMSTIKQNLAHPGSDAASTWQPELAGLKLHAPLTPVECDGYETDLLAILLQADVWRETAGKLRMKIPGPNARRAASRREYADKVCASHATRIPSRLRLNSLDFALKRQ